jgi:regulatory protein
MAKMDSRKKNSKEKSRFICICQKKVVILHPKNSLETMKDKTHDSDPFRTLLDRARNYCARAEQCEDAVRQKLVTWGASPDLSDAVVAKLYEERYLDDERYARAYCESKILHQHWGRQKVLYQLRLKHLPRAAVDSGMAAIGEEAYMAVLAEVANHKYGELQSHFDDEFLLRQKLTAFLVSRGFLLSEINQVITNIVNQ